MATVRVTHRFNAGYVRTHVAPSPGLRNALELRGLAVRTASQQRIRENPRRIDTGNLINSIQMVVFYRNGAPVVRIGTDVEYSIYVHEGTIYMEANPFLRDGLRRGMEQFR